MSSSLSPPSLIIVCCHAIWLGGPNKGADEDEWLLEPFQQGEAPTFVKHIKLGLELLEQDSNSILCFSGGPTKPSKTSLSEAQSYLNLANANDLYGHPPSTLASRIFTDDFATDSFQNVHFPLLQFPIYLSHSPFAPDASSVSPTGTQQAPPAAAPLPLNSPSPNPTPPPTLTREAPPPPPLLPRHTHLISHAFKRPRFTTLHFPTISSLLLHPHPQPQPPSTPFPPSPFHPSSNLQFTFHGIDPPMPPHKRAKVEASEREKGFEVWRADPRGEGVGLSGKRVGRGWSEERRRGLRERLAGLEGRGGGRGGNE